MRDAIRSYFQNLHTEDFCLRPKLDKLQFSRIDEITKTQLEADFSEADI